MGIRDDYLMRQFLSLARVIARIMCNANEKGISDTDELEDTIADAVGMDPKFFFSLEPESMVMMLQIGDVTDGLAEYVVRSIMFESRILESRGDLTKSELRRRQALAIADAYGCAISVESLTVRELALPFLEADTEL